MSQMSTVSTATSKARVPLFTAEAWAPLKVELFRSLWIATSIAQIGTWAREAAGPALMQSLAHNWPNRPAMVARVLVFSNLPICLFSVIAGGLADVLDRRRLLIATQIWMVIVSAGLGLLTIVGLITPWTLLGLTFLLGTGTAAFGPALQAVLPELVPPKHFSLAINMNSITLNLARAVGPALYVLVVFMIPGDKAAGIAYLLTALSFAIAAWALWRWKRAPQRAAVHGEDVWNGIHAGFIYTIHSPANRAILLRVLGFIVPAVVLWAQVPIIATDQLHMQRSAEEITAFLFMLVGCGAIFGVFLMPGLHGRYDIDPVVNTCTAFFALGLIALSYAHQLWVAAIILVFLGVNWVIIPTNFNTATQKSVPPWVKGRAISFYLTVLFGSFALGGAIWGHVTTYTSIHMSLLCGGVSMLCLLVLAIWFPLTLNAGKDLSPAYQGALPVDLLGTRPEGNGLIQRIIRYEVPAHRTQGLTDLLHELDAVRRRNGLKHWRLEKSVVGNKARIAEVLTFSSWDAYARSFSRTTKWDVMLESLTHEYRVAIEPPVIVSRAEPTPAPSPVASATIAIPLNGKRSGTAESVSRTLDRLIDELFVAYDRLNRPPR
jgi:MFS family permease